MTLIKKVSTPKIGDSGLGDNESENDNDKEDDVGGGAGAANIIWTVLNFMRKLIFL